MIVATTYFFLLEHKPRLDAVSGRKWRSWTLVQTRQTSIDKQNYLSWIAEKFCLTSQIEENWKNVVILVTLQCVQLNKLPTVIQQHCWSIPVFPKQARYSLYMYLKLIQFSWDKERAIWSVLLTFEHAIYRIKILKYMKWLCVVFLKINTKIIKICCQTTGIIFSSDSLVEKLTGTAHDRDSEVRREINAVGLGPKWCK